MFDLKNLSGIRLAAPVGQARARQWATFAVLAIATTGLAGCNGPATTSGPAASIMGSACTGAAAGHCTIVGQSLVVNDLYLSGKDTDEIGLQIENLAHALVLEGLDIDGFATAVAIDTTCSECTIEIRNATIITRGQALKVGYKGATEAGVTIRDSRIVTQESKNASAGAGGIATYNMNGKLALENVAFSSNSTQSGRAIWDYGSTELQAAKISVAGFARAIGGGWTKIQIKDGLIDCGLDAIWAKALPEVHIDGLRVHDCMASLPCGFECQPALMFFGQLGARGGNVTLRNLELTNNPWGVHIQDYEDVTVQGFTITNGGQGATMVSPGNLVLQDGIVSEHERQGMIVGGVGRMAVLNVSFVHNGFGNPRPGANNGGLDVQTAGTDAGNSAGLRTIRNSSFVGNTPFGLITGSAPIDASSNWWGSPLGPSPATPAAIGNPPVPGFGDMIVGSVIAEPHLTMPP